MMNNNIKIELSENEALVFFDWLKRFNERGEIDFFEDQAEERVLWNLEAILEKKLSGPFLGNYSKVLEKARDRLRDKE